MKIVQINSVYNRLSTGKIVHEIHEIANKYGATSYVFFGRYKKNENSKFTKYFGGKFSFFYHYLITRIFDLQGLGSVFSTYLMIRNLKKIKPDIIHLHNLHGYYINYFILFKYLKKIKDTSIVWTLHDSWAYTGHCTYYDLVGCTKWKTMCSKCPNKKKYPASYFFDNSKYNFRIKRNIFSGINRLTFITPSEWLAKDLSQSFLGKYDIRVINNGINLDIFHPVKDSSIIQKYNLPSSNIILAVAAKWEERKGINILRELIEIMPDDFNLVIVGADEKTPIVKRTNVIKIPRTMNALEMAALYSFSDVYINPTLEDNFPTTNLESIACGTPVITFKSGGSCESVVETTGICLSEKNAENLLNAIKSIIYKSNNNDFSSCRKYAEQYFSKEKSAEEYINLYKEITGE